MNRKITELDICHERKGKYEDEESQRDRQKDMQTHIEIGAKTMADR